MHLDMTKQKGKNSLLIGVGSRVRAVRQSIHLTVREFSRRADLSPRFINQLEIGEGNISISRLASVAEALGKTLPELLPPDEKDQSLRAQIWRFLNQCSDEECEALHQWLEQRLGNQSQRQFIALIGIRGAGKSTVGPLLAKKLKTEFIELDKWVEKAAGMPLGEIFSTHGESYYQRLDRESLAKLFTTSGGCVFAPGGSIVTDTESWSLIKERCTTIWLHATPQEFLKRMTRAGETRLTQNPTVMADMKALLARREPLYAESKIMIKTTGKTPAVVAGAIFDAITKNGKK